MGSILLVVVMAGVLYMVQSLSDRRQGRSGPTEDRTATLRVLKANISAHAPIDNECEVRALQGVAECMHSGVVHFILSDLPALLASTDSDEEVGGDVEIGITWRRGGQGDPVGENRTADVSGAVRRDADLGWFRSDSQLTSTTERMTHCRRANMLGAHLEQELRSHYGDAIQVLLSDGCRSWERSTWNSEPVGLVIVARLSIAGVSSSDEPRLRAAARNRGVMLAASEGWLQ